MAVGGNDFLDIVVDHGGGVNGIAGGDGLVKLEQFEGGVGVRDFYRQYVYADAGH